MKQPLGAGQDVRTLGVLLHILRRCRVLGGFDKLLLKGYKGTLILEIFFLKKSGIQEACWLVL